MLATWAMRTPALTSGIGSLAVGREDPVGYSTVGNDRTPSTQGLGVVEDFVREA